MTHRERSSRVPGLTPADRELLAGVSRQATLSEEIAFLRLRIGQLEGPNEELLLRMLALLTRMVNVQSRLPEPPADNLADLNELLRQRLVKAGFPDPEQDPGAAVRLMRQPAVKKHTGS